MIERRGSLRVAECDQAKYAEHRAERKHRQVQRGQDNAADPRPRLKRNQSPPDKQPRKGQYGSDEKTIMPNVAKIGRAA